MAKFKVEFVELVRYKTYTIVDADTPEETEELMRSSDWVREEETDSDADGTTIEVNEIS